MSIQSRPLLKLKLGFYLLLLFRVNYENAIIIIIYNLIYGDLNLKRLYWQYIFINNHTYK